MKKIFAILCGVTMMFAACTPNDGTGVVAPVFPEAQTAEVKSGDSYTLNFAANVAWTISLENDYYAVLRYNYETNTEFSGEAAEAVKVDVIVKENIKNYDEDIVIPVSLTMGDETKTLATLTIKKIERPATITLDEQFESVTFEQNGHPDWGGEFKNAAEKYHLNYSSEWDLEGVSMSCNLEGEYFVKVYAYNSTQSIANTSYITDPYITVLTGLGTAKNGFKVQMDLTKESAAWSWFDTQYESYVNFEDAEGNVLVSIFCTCTYKPAPSTGGDTPAESVVKLSQDTSTFVSGGHPSWGGEFEYAPTKYALTFGDEWACADGVALKHSLSNVVSYASYAYNAGGSIQIVNDTYLTVELYTEGLFIVKMDTAAAFAKTSCNEVTGVYEGYVNLADVDGNVLVSIYCTYNPNAQGGGETSGDVVSLVDASMASQIGVTLTKLEATAADYDATFGADYGVTDAPQYLLTYTQLSPLMMPQYAALNITGFGFAQVMGQYTIGGETWYGSQVLSVWNNPDLGGVVIEPAADYGFTAETIPNGKYPIAVYSGSGAPFARIVLEINVPM